MVEKEIVVPMSQAYVVKHSVRYNASTEEGKDIIGSVYIKKPVGDTLPREIELVIRTEPR